MAAIELPEALDQRVAKLHHEAFVFDGAFPISGLARDERGEIQALREGGVSGASVTFAQQTHNFPKAVDSVNHWKRLVMRYPESLSLCTKVVDLERCKKEGKTGFVIHFQDSKPCEDNLDYLSVFYGLGLRVLQLTYNVQGYAGTGCCERHDAGLSSFGVQMVRECNRLGIVVDLSHCGHGTAWDTVKHTQAPVAFTHVGVYSVCPAYGRNKPDELLKAVAETGGVIGITFFPAFLKRNAATHQVLPSTLHDVLDHIEYATRLVGVDHVGLGSDLANYYARTLEVSAESAIRWFRDTRPDVYGVGTPGKKDPFPPELNTHAKMRNLTRGLVQRGYTDEEVKKILGGNWLRLFKKVWKG